jgi:tropomyosin
VDVKAEHFERQVSRVEQERDEWERKHGVSYGVPFGLPELAQQNWTLCRPSTKSADSHQEAVEKYQQSKRELDEVVAQMESLVSYVRPFLTETTTDDQ